MNLVWNTYFHPMKSVHFPSFPGPFFLTLELNTERSEDADPINILNTNSTLFLTIEYLWIFSMSSILFGQLKSHIQYDFKTFHSVYLVICFLNKNYQLMLSFVKPLFYLDTSNSHHHCKFNLAKFCLFFSKVNDFFFCRTGAIIIINT